MDLALGAILLPICWAVLWTDLAWLRRGNFTPRQMVPPRQLTPHFPICGAVLWTDLAWTWHWAQFYTKAILLPICGAALWTDLAWTWHLAQGKLLHRGNFTPRQFYAEAILRRGNFTSYRRNLWRMVFCLTDLTCHGPGERD